MQFAELRRWQDFRNPGSQGNQYFLGLEEVLKGSGEPSYPGQRPRNSPTFAKFPVAPPSLVLRTLPYDTELKFCLVTAGGQFFNLFNLGKTEAAMKDLRTKELKNGRLAMLAGMGIWYMQWCMVTACLSASLNISTRH